MPLPYLFNPARWNDWEQWLDQHAANLIAIAVIVIILNSALGWFVGRLMRQIIRRAAHRRLRNDREALERRTDTLVSLFRWFMNAFVIFLALVLVMDEFGKNVNALIAGLGVAGLAVGLAGQQLIRDFINGMTILVEDQYAVGDVVTVAGVTGEVEQVNPRRTVLRDLDGSVHIVPNSAISVATNLTEGFGRVNLDISVGYKENLGRVVEVINNECVAFAMDFKNDVLTEPAVLRVNDLGDSGIDIKILGDVRAGQQWALMGELRRRIKDRFDREGIEIPFPHRTIVTGGEAQVQDIDT